MTGSINMHLRIKIPYTHNIIIAFTKPNLGQKYILFILEEMKCSSRIVTAFSFVILFSIANVRLKFC